MHLCEGTEQNLLFEKRYVLRWNQQDVGYLCGERSLKRHLLLFWSLLSWVGWTTLSILFTMQGFNHSVFSQRLCEILCYTDTCYHLRYLHSCTGSASLVCSSPRRDSCSALPLLLPSLWKTPTNQAKVCPLLHVTSLTGAHTFHE